MLTIRGNHLQCDLRNDCISCSVYTWPPKAKKPKRYYHCDKCNLDILCEKGLSANYNYYEDGYVERKVRCIKCGSILQERIWPSVPKQLKNEILKI